MRYMVRYRTPQHTQTKKRGFTTKRDAEAFANTVEVEKLTGNYVAPALGQVTSGRFGTGMARPPGAPQTELVGAAGISVAGPRRTEHGVAVASLTFGEPKSKHGYAD